MPTQDHVRQFGAYLAHERHRSPATVRGYTSELGLFVRQLVPLEREFIAAWLGTGVDGQPLAPATRNHRLVVVREFCKWLAEKHIIPMNPADGIGRAPVPRVHRAAVSVDDLRGVVAAALAANGPDWRRLRDATVIRVLFATGLRISELRSLNVGDVDMSAALLRKVSRKGGHQVDVPLNEDASEALAGWFALRPASPDVAVFVGGTRMARLSVRALQKRVRELGDAAGLKMRLHPHALRHAHATAMLRTGSSTEIIRQSLNHASLETTQRYLHGDLDDLRLAVAKIPRLDTGKD
jgi:site-specific recombinase XerC